MLPKWIKRISANSGPGQVSLRLSEPSTERGFYACSSRLSRLRSVARKVEAGEQSDHCIG